MPALGTLAAHAPTPQNPSFSLCIERLQTIALKCAGVESRVSECHWEGRGKSIDLFFLYSLLNTEPLAFFS